MRISDWSSDVCSSDLLEFTCLSLLVGAFLSFAFASVLAPTPTTTPTAFFRPIASVLGRSLRPVGGTFALFLLAFVLRGQRFLPGLVAPATTTAAAALLGGFFSLGFG